MSFEGWEECKLGDIIEFQRGHDLTISNIADGQYPVIGSSGIIGYHNKATTKGPGVTIGRSGNSVGKPFFIEKDFWAHNTTLFVKNFKKVSPKFFYYFLQTLNLKSFDGGSAVPTLNRNHLYELQISIPSIESQIRIEKILSSLDNKIELNQQTNETLEAIAKTLFKEWFVDFHFPDATGEMVESVSGMIPKGWAVGNVGDMLELQRGFDLPASIRLEGNFPVYAASGINGYHNEYKVRAPGITTGRSGVLGNVFYVQEDFWPLNTSLYIKEFKIATPLFALYLLQSLDLKGLNGGSAVPTLNRNEVHKMKVYLPDKTLIELFETMSQPIYRAIQANTNQNHTLTQIRNNLLSKLAQGELLTT